MPLYEYICRKCQHTYEKIQKFSDPLDVICPKCSGPVEKQVAGTNFQLKGGGWYKDGYASKKPEAKTESQTEKKTEKKAEAPTTKPKEKSTS